MYKIKTIFFLLLVVSFNSVLAQKKNCKNYETVPEEYYRNGYYQTNRNAGFPYTIFNK